ncbi:MAG: hypothetical protein N3E49_00340 [Bacteroidia bacterium]|nr:hypothetical protein [Bacteroidia bacterium]
MLWVADAGATKTDWMGVESKEPLRTEGLNAEVEGWEAAQTKLYAAAEMLRGQGASIGEIHYYGPALHSEAARSSIQVLLIKAFQLPPDRVFVYHDLLGAARAAWGAHSGVVAILGTGSNCALWEGQTIQKQAGGHGYLLGDEGSGADIGRCFLSALLHGEVPRDIETDFWRENPYPEASAPLELRRLAYRSQRPSAFFAKFSYFLHSWKAHPWVVALVKGRFAAFIQRTWAIWGVQRPIRYVGGVACAFSDVLREVTEAYGGRWEGVVSSVIHSLLRYHVQR